MIRRSLTILWLLAALTAALVVSAVTAQEEGGPVAEVNRLLDQAKKLGAKGQLPLAWWDLQERRDAAEAGLAGDETWDQLILEARLLVNRAAFIDEMRKRRSGMEAMLGRFDQALAEIAALYGLAPDPVLTGTAAANDLVDRLSRENLRRQVLVDSLTVSNRYLNEVVGGSSAARESTITALRLDTSRLRRQLWEMELRAGVAEADRSAAETVLRRRQELADAIAGVRSSFTAEEADVILDGDGSLLLRVHGMAFGVGNAELAGGQDDLLGRIADAIAAFPGSEVRIEGHTDNTGSRDTNLRLSRRRAETVAARLEVRLGRPAGSLPTEGLGPDRPVALNATPEGRARNRRIDVVIRPAS